MSSALVTCTEEVPEPVYKARMLAAERRELETHQQLEEVTSERDALRAEVKRLQRPEGLEELRSEADRLRALVDRYRARVDESEAWDHESDDERIEAIAREWEHSGHKGAVVANVRTALGVRTDASILPELRTLVRDREVARTEADRLREVVGFWERSAEGGRMEDAVRAALEVCWRNARALDDETNCVEDGVLVYREHLTQYGPARGRDA